MSSKEPKVSPHFFSDWYKCRSVTYTALKEHERSFRTYLERQIWILKNEVDPIRPIPHTPIDETWTKEDLEELACYEELRVNTNQFLTDIKEKLSMLEIIDAVEKKSPARIKLPDDYSDIISHTKAINILCNLVADLFDDIEKRHKS